MNRRKAIKLLGGAAAGGHNKLVVAKHASLSSAYPALKHLTLVASSSSDWA